MRTTYMAKPADIEKKWYVVDATDKTLGRLASEIAKVLRGKNKAIYTPHIDTGDYVIIVNADKIKVTGHKLDNKMYKRNSGWIGGLKETSYKVLMSSKPEKAMMLAVKGMLPSNVIGRKSLTRLRVYRDVNHQNAAQKPQPYNG